MSEPYFHVTSVLNRDSIRTHGLDWSRMGVASGIAGSSYPEAEGIFLARDVHEADWFVGLNNTGGSVDVWQVRGVEATSLVESGNGYAYLPRTVPAADVTLVASDLGDPDRAWEDESFKRASVRQVEVHLEGGVVLTGDDAQQWFRTRRLRRATEPESTRES